MSIPPIPSNMRCITAAEPQPGTNRKAALRGGFFISRSRKPATRRRGSAGSGTPQIPKAGAGRSHDRLSTAATSCWSPGPRQRGAPLLPKGLHGRSASRQSQATQRPDLSPDFRAASPSLRRLSIRAGRGLARLIDRRCRNPEQSAPCTGGNRQLIQFVCKTDGNPNAKPATVILCQTHGVLVAKRAVIRPLGSADGWFPAYGMGAALPVTGS